MSHNIGDILEGQKWSEPPEIRRLKRYIREHFQADASIMIQPKQIIITVKGAALAGTLRLHSHSLAEACQVDKRLVFRIG